MLKGKKKKVWRRQAFLPQGKISSVQAVRQIGVSLSPCIRSLRASTLFTLCWETVISFVCQIFSPHLLDKMVCCVGASFLMPEKTFNLLIPAWWGALYLLCSAHLWAPGVLCCPVHPFCIPHGPVKNPHPNTLEAARVWSRSHLFSHLSGDLISHIWFSFQSNFYSLSLFQLLIC